MREVKSKFSDTEIQFDKLKSEISRLEGVSQERLKQVEEQRELLKQIDGERDAVQTDLDAKAEKIVELQGTIVHDFLAHPQTRSRNSKANALLLSKTIMVNESKLIL